MTARNTLLWTASTFLLYLATAHLGLKYAVIGRTVTLLWPPSGIALAAVLIGGYRVWVGIILGAFVANMSADLPITSLLIISIGNTLEPLCGAFLLKRNKNFSIALDKVPDVFALVFFSAIISTSISASFGTLALLVGGLITYPNFGSTWLAWWLGDGMGVIVISPLILIGYYKFRDRLPLFLTLFNLEMLGLLFLLSVVGQATFGNFLLADPGYFPISLSMFPFAIWSALRFDSFGAALVALITSLLAINGTVHGTGPFAVSSELESLVLWCLFADLTTITGLLLAAVNCERKKALTALKNANMNLEIQVQERTNELTTTNKSLKIALAERRKLQLEMNEISEQRQKIIGQELHDGLGQQLLGVAFLVTSLFEKITSKLASEANFVSKIRDELDNSISLVRLLSRGLYPVCLETNGINSALQHLADYTNNASEVSCQFKSSILDIKIDNTYALNLYRIAQEAVTNAIRHGKAQQITIALSSSEDQYTLSIIDNGIGFYFKGLENIATLGFRSMRCRAEFIGAKIQVLNNQSGGMAIVITGSIS